MSVQRTGAPPASPAYLWNLSPGSGGGYIQQGTVETIKPGDTRTYSVTVTRRPSPYPPSGECTARMWIEGEYSTEVLPAHEVRDFTLARGASQTFPLQLTVPVDADASKDHGFAFKYNVRVGMYHPHEPNGPLEFDGYCDTNGGWSNPQSPHHVETKRECIVPTGESVISEGLPPTGKPHPSGNPGWWTDGIHPYDPLRNISQHSCGQDYWQLWHHTRGLLTPSTTNFSYRRIEERTPSPNPTGDACHELMRNHPQLAARQAWASSACDQPYNQVTFFNAKQSGTAPGMVAMFGSTPTGYSCDPNFIECPWPLEDPGGMHSSYGSKVVPGTAVFDVLGRGKKCLGLMYQWLPDPTECSSMFEQQMMISCGGPDSNSRYKYTPYHSNVIIDHVVTKQAGNTLNYGLVRGNSDDPITNIIDPAGTWRGCDPP